MEEILRKLFVVIFYVIAFSVEITGQLYTAVYKKLDQNIFGKNITISIAIFPFTNKGQYVNFTKDIYDALTSDKEILEKFLIFPYSTIWDQKETFNITNFNIKNISTLNKLKDILGIKFIITGEFSGEKKDKLILRIYKTSDGSLVFNSKYIESINSNILQDVLNLFKENKKTLYKRYFIPTNLVLIKGGTFKMGSTIHYDEEPIHNVSLNDYYINKYEVTFAEYDLFSELTGRLKPSDDGFGRGNMPVINVTWEDAEAFCNWLSQVNGEKYSLPTEAEWEYAARGGSLSLSYLYSGNNNIDSVAWFNNNSNYSIHIVGSKKPNELGLYDMSGNVWEWCLDWYARDYYTSSPINNPRGPGFTGERVVRGGSWNSYKENCRNTSRFHINPRAYYQGKTGFRYVMHK